MSARNREPVCWLLAAVASAACGIAHAEPAVEQPLEYRRFFVPADRPQDWPKRNVPYLPVEREEFERLLDAANSRLPSSRLANSAHVVQAAYQAELTDDYLHGQVRLEVRHSGGHPVLMPLDPLGLAIADSKWEKGGPAVLGLADSRKTAVIVGRSDALLLDWSLRGKRDAGGALVFKLELPPSAICRFNVDLPESIVPVLDDGVAAGSSVDQKRGRWRFELGGRTHSVLKLQASESHGRQRRLVLLQEKTTYRFSPGGLDVASQLKLDVHREPIRRLQLDLDPPLRVVSVQYGGNELNWSVDASRPEGKQALSVDFVEPLLGTGKVITVTALAPLAVGKPMRLPRWQARDVAWQEGDAALLLPPPLALDALLPAGCRQTKATSSGGGAATGESIDLQLFSPEATAEVQVSRRRQQLVLTSGSTIRFASDRLRAEMRGNFELVEGQAFSLQAHVGAGWQIDSVTADRNGALAGWSIDRSTRPASLVVQLAEPLRPAHALMLMVTGHRSVSAGHRFTAAALEMLSFYDCLERHRLLALEISGSHRVWLDGADRPALTERSKLAEAERALLASALGDTILEFDPQRPDWNVVIEPQSPRYAADLRVTARCLADRLIESYSVRCQPEASRVDRVLMAFSQAREQPLRFSLTGSEETLPAERLSSDEQAARGLADAGEIWLVHLPQAAGDAFELRALRDVPFAGTVMPALISVPEADSQQATMEILAAQDPPLIRHADRLEPMPLAAPRDDRYSTLRAAFRYDPIEELGGELAEAVVLSRRDNSGADEATIWRLRLHSHYGLSGNSRNLAVFDLENHGRSRCSIHVPAGAELSHVAVDGLAIAVQQENDGISVPLPAERRFPLLTVEYSLPGASLGIIKSCRAPWPTADMAVAAREWLVSVPGSYQAWTSSGSPFTRPWPLRCIRAQGRQQRPFDVTSALEWRQLKAGSATEDQRFRLAARLLEALGRKLAVSDPTVDTWGRLLAEAANDEKTLLPLLFVDAHSFSQLDVGPATPLDRWSVPSSATGQISSQAAQAAAAQLLRNHGLAVLAEDDRLVLTGRWLAGEAANDHAPVGRHIVFCREAAHLPGDRRWPESSRDVALPAWLAEPEMGWERNSPTTAFSELAVDARIIEGSTGAVSLWLVRGDVVLAAAAALSAVFASLSVWLFRGCRSAVVLLAGSAATAAIWSPPPLAVLPWGAVAGCLVAIVWHWLRPKSPDRRSSASTGGATTAARGVGTMVFVLATSAAASRVPGQEQTRPEADDEPAVHNVFVPVDDGGKPGSLYQVPLDFLDELRRRAMATSDEPRGWLLTGAAYQCSLVTEKPEDQVNLGDLLVRYDLRVISADARIRLRFDRRQAELVPDSSTLDGQPSKLTWDDEGLALVLNVADPGDYVLEFRILPTINNDGESRGLDMAVPPIAASTVNVSFPVDLADVELPSSLGEVRLEGGRLRANLGPTDRLSLRWPRQSAGQAQVQVEQLLWLKIRPGSVVLDVELNYDIAGGVLRQLQFAAERRLRLMPGTMPSKERTLPSEATAADSLQVTQIELERPAGERLSVNLSFLVSGASGVGNVRLPAFQVQNARVSRRWLAVTVDPALQYEAHEIERLDPLPAADFVAAWHNADPAAFREALAYRLDRDDVPWSLATRSREPRTTAKEVLGLSFERTVAMVRYNAQLATTGGFVFQHRLRVPPDLQIDDVAFEEDGTERAVRWARGDDQHLTLFFPRRVTGAQRLTLRGRLPIRANGRFSLPSLSMAAAETDAVERMEVVSRTLELYRRPQVRIALENSEGLHELTQPAAEPPHADFGRLVLSGAADETYSGTVVVSPNQQRITGARQFSALRYANQAWVAEIEYRFQAERGVVDAVAFDVPANWGPNLEVLAPAATVALADQPGKARKVLTVWPLKPLSGPCQVRIRSPLKSVPGEPIAAPDVVPLAAAADRYWCLPNQVGIESVAWDVERMAPAMLPEGEPPPFADTESFAVFRAIGDHPQAVIGSTKAATGAARVRLSDVRLATDGDTWKGIAAFDIEPGGHATCPLRLASDWRLTAATVNGLAVVPLPDRESADGLRELVEFAADRSDVPLPERERAWQVPLSSNRLPQRVELLLERIGHRSDAGAPLSMPVAWLDGFPVEDSLLSVHAPEGCRAELDAARVDAASCAAARIESVISLVDLPEEVVATISPDDLAAWYRPWAHWLGWCDRQSNLGALADGDAPISRPAAWENSLRIARRIGVDGVPAGVSEQRLVAFQPMEIWSELHRSAPVALFRWSAASSPRELRLRRRLSDGWRTRGVATGWLMIAVAAALILPRFTVLADLPRRWPHLAVAASGLMWWLFCQPSVGGWLLIAIGLLAALNSALKPLQISPKA